MSVKKLVSIRESVFNAIEDIGGYSSNDVPVFTRWASFAITKDIQSIGSLKKKIFVLDVKNCQAELPCCVISVKAVLLGDRGCDCGINFDQYYSMLGNGVLPNLPMFEGAAFAIIDSKDSNNYPLAGTSWFLQDNCIVFKVNAYNGTKITIQCIAIDEDNDGFPMVSDNAVEAVTQYIKLKYSERSRYGRSRFKMNIGDIRDIRQEYHRLVAMARADDAKLSEAEYTQIAHMLNDPYVGWGVSMGMNQHFNTGWGWQ